MAEAIVAAAEVSDLDDDAQPAELQAWFRFWAAQGFFQVIA